MKVLKEMLKICLKKFKQRSKIDHNCYSNKKTKNKKSNLLMMKKKKVETKNKEGQTVIKEEIINSNP